MLISIMQNGVHGHKVNTSLIDCNYLTGPIIVKNNDDKAKPDTKTLFSLNPTRISSG